jgi:Holliday junction resolvase RusA-like endonuclease
MKREHSEPIQYLYFDLESNPPSHQANCLQTKTGRRYKTTRLSAFQDYLNFETASKLKLNGDKLPLHPIENLRMDIIISPVNKRHGDITNMRKSIEDAFEGVLYTNDKQIKAGDTIIDDNFLRYIEIRLYLL